MESIVNENVSSDVLYIEIRKDLILKSVAYLKDPTRFNVKCALSLLDAVISLDTHKSFEKKSF